MSANISRNKVLCNRKLNANSEGFHQLNLFLEMFALIIISAGPTESRGRQKLFVLTLMTSSNTFSPSQVKSQLCHQLVDWCLRHLFVSTLPTLWSCYQIDTIEEFLNQSLSGLSDEIQERGSWLSHGICFGSMFSTKYWIAPSMFKEVSLISTEKSLTEKYSKQSPW